MSKVDPDEDPEPESGGTFDIPDEEIDRIREDMGDDTFDDFVEAVKELFGL
jgi:hypothetical protein